MKKGIIYSKAESRNTNFNNGSGVPLFKGKDQHKISDNKDQERVILTSRLA